MENVIKEKRERTPEENLAIAKIQVMMEDSFGLLSNSESSPALQDRAKRWFDSADCSLWCDMAGTTHDHIKNCLLYTSPSPRDLSTSRMPSSA